MNVLKHESFGGTLLEEPKSLRFIFLDEMTVDGHPALIFVVLHNYSHFPVHLEKNILPTYV